MAIRTRVTDMLGIAHPIVLGGMQHVGYAGLASAVSNAGGLGMLTALTQPSPQALREEIARCRGLTDKPFGVNLSVFPTINATDYHAFAEAILDSGVKIVETAGTSAVQPIWAQLKAGGVTILHKCTSVRHALKAESAGCDIISIDGFECAGHPGEDDIPSLVLLPVAADRIRVPLLASGGFGDGRGLVAALALGADGITMGTRLCATREAPIHDHVKQAYINNDERDTVLLFREFKNSARVGRSDVSAEVVRRLAKPGAVFEDVKALVSGAAGKKLLETGDLSSGVYWAGLVQGLIHDIPTCEELISRIMAEANEIIQQRLPASLR